MTELWSAALQLGIGGLSVAGIIYVSIKHSETTKIIQEQFLEALDRRSDRHEARMKESETALRDVERSVRESFASQITENTIALRDVARVLGRAVSVMGEDK